MSTASDPSLIAIVHQLLMHGAARWQIEQAVCEQFRDAPQPTKEQIDAAYAACVENWVNDADQDPDHIHAYHLALRKSLLSKAITINDYPTAARIAQDLAKLQDQYQSARAAAHHKPVRESRIDRLRSRSARLRVVGK